MDGGKKKTRNDELERRLLDLVDTRQQATTEVNGRDDDMVAID